jgi:hypothetical protein
MLYRELTSLCAENNIENTNALYRQNVEFFNVEPSGKYNHHWALKG